MVLLTLAAAACGSSAVARSPSTQKPAETPVMESQPPSTPSSPSPSSPASPPSPQASPRFDGSIGPAGGPGAASGLAANPRCEQSGSRVGVADLTWVPASTPGAEQRIALTIFPEGFDTGNFQVSPPLPPTATSYTWQGTNPGGAHRWRVLTRHGGTWTPSEIQIFTGATCVADNA